LLAVELVVGRDGRVGLPGALGDGGEEVEEAGVFGFFQSSLDLVFR